MRRSCCHWRRALPAYYVITDAQTVSMWDFQGAVAPDIEVVNMQQSELAERFDELYARRNPRAAAAAPPRLGRLRGRDDHYMNVYR